MGSERRSSKGVGGFLQLFDWNSKSRKKLLYNKSDFSEQSKQARSDRSLQMDEDESRGGSSVKGSEYSYASSVVDDDGYGEIRAPSVLARLMGLDSMPTSNCSEPSSTPFFDAQSLRSSHYQRETTEYERENQMYYSRDHKADCQSSYKFDSKPQKQSGRPIEKFRSEILPPRSAKSIPITQHKLLSPIKSSGMFFTGDAAHIMEAAAKIIESGSQTTGKNKMPLAGSSSVPIKVRDLKEKVGAGQEKPEARFGPFRMREKEKFDAGQENTSSGNSSMSFKARDKERVDPLHEKSSIGYSSVSLRMRDKGRTDTMQETTGTGYVSSYFGMRDKNRVDAADERLEIGCNSASFRERDEEKPSAPPKSSRPALASEKPVESSATKYLKGLSMNQSWNGSGDTMPFGTTSNAEVASSSNKVKSVSLAIQAKVNVQKRQGMRVNPLSSLAGQKEQPEAKSQQNTVRNMHKRSSRQNASGVLRHNNQRQNNATDKDVPSKPLISNSQGKKALTRNSYPTRPGTLNKPGGSSRTRKMNLEAKINDSDHLNTEKNVPRKKRNIDGGLQFDGNQNIDNGLKISLKSDANIDRCAWIEDSGKKGMDVVSFTFTSPMTRPTSGFSSPSQMAQGTDGLFPNNWGKKSLLNSESKVSSSHGLNVIGSDALSLLLEQKLRELTTGIGPSSHDDVKLGSASNFEANILSQDADSGSTSSRLNEHPVLHTNRFGNRFDSGFRIDPLLLRNEHELQVVDEMDGCSSGHTEANNLHDCHLPSSLSVLEESVSADSGDSSSTIDCGMEDGKPRSYVQACEMSGVGSSKRLHLMEAELDLSDSGSSICPGIVTEKQAATLIATNTSESASKWELNYVKHTLSNVDIMFDNFSAGITPCILNSQLFEQLESSTGWSAGDNTSSKLERRLCFDCVGESLDLRCRRYVGGGCEAWSKGMSMMVTRKDRLLEEVNKEILELTGMGDCMVDELVEKDMSSQHGRWLNFEAEEFSLGVEMECQIINSLVDEMVADILLC
uniref:DUF4378 domain-containing protein n=1 Tax=Kalanchoe fedtschenkoi TaxID=63787 RepID=A0A7N1A0F1_KALFE